MQDEEDFESHIEAAVNVEAKDSAHAVEELVDQAIDLNLES